MNDTRGGRSGDYGQENVPTILCFASRGEAGSDNFDQ